MKKAASAVARANRQRAVDTWQRLPDELSEKWHNVSRDLAAELSKPAISKSIVEPLLTRLANTYPHIAYHVSQWQGFGTESIKMAIEIGETAVKVGQHQIASDFLERALIAVRSVTTGLSDAVMHAACLRGLTTALLGVANGTPGFRAKHPLEHRELCVKAASLLQHFLHMQEQSHGTDDKILQGTLMQLGTAAEGVGDWEMAHRCFTRNRAMKQRQQLPTLAVEKKVAEVEKKMEQQTPAERALASKLFRLQYEEYEGRLKVLTGHLRIVVGVHKLERQQYLANGWKSGPRRAHRSDLNPRSGGSSRDSSPAKPENPVDAAILFRTLIASAKAAVQAKAFGEAIANYRRALEVGQDPANKDEIHSSDLVVVLGSLGFAHCMHGQQDVQKGTPEYRAAMAQAVEPYREAIALMDQVRKTGGKVAPETMESAVMQLGIVACNIDRPEAGMHFLKKCRALKQRRNADVAIADKHITAVERALKKRDGDLIALATQRLERRGQNVEIPTDVTARDAAAMVQQAKRHMQAKNLKEAEQTALTAVHAFDSLADTNPDIASTAEYRQALSTAAAVYYSLGQQAAANESAPASAFVGFNQLAVCLYHRAIAALRNSAASEDDAPFAPLLFNLACSYVNIERYSTAVGLFNHCRRVKEKHGQDFAVVDQNLQALGHKAETTLERHAAALVRAATSPTDQLNRAESSLSIMSGGNLALESSMASPTRGVTSPASPSRVAAAAADDDDDVSSEEEEFTLDGSMSISLAEVQRARERIDALRGASSMWLEEHRSLLLATVEHDVSLFHRDTHEELEALSRLCLENAEAHARIPLRGALLHVQAAEQQVRTPQYFAMLHEHFTLAQALHFEQCVDFPYTLHLWWNVAPLRLEDEQHISRDALIATEEAARNSVATSILLDEEETSRANVVGGFMDAGFLVAQAEELRRCCLTHGEAHHWLQTIDEARGRYAVISDEQVSREHVADLQHAEQLVLSEAGLRTSIFAEHQREITALFVDSEHSTREIIAEGGLATLAHLIASHHTATLEQDEAVQRQAMAVELATALADCFVQSSIVAKLMTVESAVVALCELQMEQHSQASLLAVKELLFQESVSWLELTLQSCDARLSLIEEEERCALELRRDRSAAEADEGSARSTVACAEEQDRAQLYADAAVDMEFVARWALFRLESNAFLCNIIAPDFEVQEGNARAVTIVQPFWDGITGELLAEYEGIVLVQDGEARLVIVDEEEAARRECERHFLRHTIEDHESGARQRVEREADAEFHSLLQKKGRELCACAEHVARSGVIDDFNAVSVSLSGIALQLSLQATMSRELVERLFTAESWMRSEVEAFEERQRRVVIAADGARLSVLSDEARARACLVKDADESRVDMFATGAQDTAEALARECWGQQMAERIPLAQELFAVTCVCFTNDHAGFHALGVEQLASRCALEATWLTSWQQLMKLENHGSELHVLQQEAFDAARDIEGEYGHSIAAMLADFIASVAEPHSRQVVADEEAGCWVVAAAEEITTRGLLAHASLASLCIHLHQLALEELHNRAGIFSDAQVALRGAAGLENDRYGVILAETTARRQLIARYNRSRSTRLQEHVVSVTEAHRRRIVGREASDFEVILTHELRSREMLLRLSREKVFSALLDLHREELGSRAALLREEERCWCGLATGEVESDETAVRGQLVVECAQEHMAFVAMCFGHTQLARGIARIYIPAVRNLETLHRILILERAERTQREELMEAMRRGLLSTRLGFDAPFPIGRSRQLRQAKVRLAAQRRADDYRLPRLPPTFSKGESTPRISDSPRASTALPGMRRRSSQQLDSLPSSRPSSRPGTGSGSRPLPRIPSGSGAAAFSPTSSAASPSAQAPAGLPPIAAPPAGHRKLRPVAGRANFASRVETHESFQRDRLTASEATCRFVVAAGELYELHRTLVTSEYRRTMASVQRAADALVEAYFGHGARLIMSSARDGTNTESSRRRLPQLV